MNTRSLGVLRIRQIAAVATLTLCASTACSTDSQVEATAVERVDSAGIEVVRVSPAADPTSVVVTPMARIGNEGLEGDVHDTFEYLSDVLPLADGRVAVIDNRAARVAVFSASGDWLFDIGRQGSGPGEHRGPIYGSVLADTVFIWDQLQRRMSVFLDNGVFMESVSIPAWRSASRFVAEAGSYLREIESGQMNDPAPAAGALVQFDRQGMIQDTVAGPYPVPEYGFEVDPSTGHGVMVNPPALAIAPPWTVHRGSLLLLDPIEAEIRVVNIDPRRMARVIRVPQRAMPTSDQDRAAFIRGIQAEFGFPDVDLESHYQSTLFAELKPSVAGLLVGEEDRVWIAEHDAGARSARYIGSVWWILDLEKGFVGIVRFPAGFRLIATQHDRAYGISTLGSGIQVVDIFGLGME